MPKKGSTKRDFNHCNVCGSSRSYLNPFSSCFECKKRFCFDHIWGGQVNSKMKDNDWIRDICDECRDKHKYKTL